MLRSVVPRVYRHVCHMRPLTERQARGIWSRARLIPVQYRRNFLDDFCNPRSYWPLRMMDSQFKDMERLMDAMLPPRYGPRWRDYGPGCRARATAGRDVEVKHDGQGFEVKVDVEQFSPEDLKVKLKGDSLLISAKHEAKSDEYGVVSREFSREFSLPENVDTESIESRITEDGYLVIKGNVKNAENAEEVDINITREDPEAGKPKDK